MTDDITAQNKLFENMNDALYEIIQRLPTLDENSIAGFNKFMDILKDFKDNDD